MEAFLYHRASLRTGRALGRALASGGARRVLRGQAPAYLLRNSSGPINRLIRWGHQGQLTAAEVLNTSSAIANASDKYRTLHLLQEAGLRVPAFARSLDALAPTVAVLGRRRRGSRGRDIQIVRSADRTLPATPIGGVTRAGLEACEFFTEYVPNTREYRVHVFRDQVIRVQGKYLDFPEQHTNPYIKNYAQGFRFRSPNLTLHQDRLDAAVAAVQALGLDFGAVDLLIGEDGNYYILEVNTAPSCSPLTARAYVDRFAEWLGVEPDYTQLEALRAD